MADSGSVELAHWTRLLEARPPFSHSSAGPQGTVRSSDANLVGAGIFVVVRHPAIFLLDPILPFLIT